MTTSRNRLRRTAAAAGLAAALIFPATGTADTVDIDFQLDWRFEGPSAPFLMSASRGYFEDEGLDVSIDSGSGSAETINRVASGAYDMGFGDLNALVEFLANNPDAPSLSAVFVVYDGSPAAVFAKKSSGIEEPADLAGKTLAAPSFDTGRRAWPLFARANDLEADSVSWDSVDPALREQLLASDDVDAITGFYFTSLLNLESRGIAEEDLVIMPFPEYGVELYGNVIVARDSFIEEHPEAVSGFLRAFTRGMAATLEDPDGAVDYVLERDDLVERDMEVRRLKLAIEGSIDTPAARENGLGAVDMERLELTIGQVADVFELEDNVPSAEDVFNSDFLPDQDDRMVFPD
ncbi:ABC transporter substrate-binding protein [Aquisalimonas asiatica]|uniref:Thiamine pyrimidine synthase n=1 Tax=Aquisalimonas asiatica TaxID=406100 RepID=A0A1H8UW83_9GAMM|nr:ABC transporter substrate-binding protein [Aquisalimonas asiatica]SEP06828.1 NitT/TauT family transport system substrate-binding protein [Aquisalimonas asiatica]